MHSSSVERWRPIPYGDGYEVSDFGRVRSNPSRRILQPKPRANGYVSVSLKRGCPEKRFYVHRLVVAAFIRELKEDQHVNHLDFNRSHNSLENLEIVTRQENAEYSKRAGRYAENGRNTPRGDNSCRSKLDSSKVLAIREAYRPGSVTMQTLARAYGICTQQISNIVHRRSWVDL